MGAERSPAASDPAGRKRLAVLDVGDSVRVADPEQLLSGVGCWPQPLTRPCPGRE